MSCHEIQVVRFVPKRSKMKMLLFMLSLVMPAFGSTPGLRADCQGPKADTSIPNPHHHKSGEDVLKESSVPPGDAARSFYQWYLHALYQSPDADPFKEHKTDVEKYVTARLLQKLANSRRTSTVRKGPDVDTEYFFQTLDLDSDWEKNITVSKPTMKGAAAVVHVTLSGRDDSGKDLKVVLRQESGLWKIDDVELWR